MNFGFLILPSFSSALSSACYLVDRFEYPPVAFVKKVNVSGDQLDQDKLGCCETFSATEIPEYFVTHSYGVLTCCCPAIDQASPVALSLVLITVSYDAVA